MSHCNASFDDLIKICNLAATHAGIMLLVNICSMRQDGTFPVSSETFNLIIFELTECPGGANDTQTKSYLTCLATLMGE